MASFLRQRLRRRRRQRRSPWTEGELWCCSRAPALRFRPFIYRRRWFTRWSRPLGATRMPTRGAAGDLDGTECATRRRVVLSGVAGRLQLQVVARCWLNLRARSYLSASLSLSLFRAHPSSLSPFCSTTRPSRFAPATRIPTHSLTRVIRAHAHSHAISSLSTIFFLPITSFLPFHLPSFVRESISSWKRGKNRVERSPMFFVYKIVARVSRRIMRIYGVNWSMADR